MSSDESAVRMIAPGKPPRKVDVPASQVEQHKRRGFAIDTFPDCRVQHIRTYAGKHKGRPAIVIGNGPSAASMRPEAIEHAVRAYGAIVWAVNNSWSVLGGKPIGTVHYHVVLDTSFWECNHARLLESFARTGCVPVTCWEVQDDIDYMMIGIPLDQTAASGPEYRPGAFFHGESSGVIAIQMAMQCGCDPIVLVGHDLNTFGTMTHGFGKRTDDELKQRYPQGKMMMPAYKLLAKHAGSAMCTILNASRVSAIECFPKVCFGDVFK